MTGHDVSRGAAREGGRDPGRDPGPALLRGMHASAAAAGMTLTDATIDTADWASATFVGHRHRIGFVVRQGDAARWLAGLPEAEWRLPGHVVVDIARDGADGMTGATVALWALTLIDLRSGPEVGGRTLI